MQKKGKIIMWVDFTDKEALNLSEITEEYETILQDLRRKIQLSKDHSEEEAELFKQYDAIAKEFSLKVYEIQDKAEQRSFDALGTDPEKVYNDALYSGAECLGRYFMHFQPLPEDPDFSNKIRKHLDELRDKGSIKPKFYEQYVKEYEEKKVYPLLADKEEWLPFDTAKEFIEKELRRHLAFLKAKNAELYNKLNDKIVMLITECPFVLEEPDKKEKELPIKGQMPKIDTYGIMNDKISTQMTNGDMIGKEINGQFSFLLNSIQQKRENVHSYVALTYVGELPTVSKKITAFDIAVLNAVATANYNFRRKHGEGKPFYFTDTEIWHLMNGITDQHKKPSKAQIEKVKASIFKMRYTEICLNFSEELEAFHYYVDDKRVIKGEVRTYLLEASWKKVTTEKGQTIEAYELGNEPILYTYNAMKKHVLFVPFELLNTSETTGNEGYTVEFRQYLLQQIQLMKNGYRNNNRILFDTMYNTLGIPEPAERVSRSDFANENTYRTKVKQTAKADREKIQGILEAWKNKKYIVGYELVKEGKTFSGVDIIYSQTYIE